MQSNHPRTGVRIAMIDMRKINLESLNSATKYPSIVTFHERDPKRGMLTEKPIDTFAGNVLLTEKVDGTGTRIVAFPNGDYIIGSREHLLHARGDLVANLTDGVVETLRPVADALWTPGSGTQVVVLYLEVYGGNIGRNASQYTGNGRTGFRMFDAAAVPGSVLVRTPAEAASWREDGGQNFLTEQELQDMAVRQGIGLTPRLGMLPASEVPTGIEEMHAFLTSRIPETNVALDADAGRIPEGIVLRTEDRSVIAKARLQDYANTLRRRSGR
ncbi:RNA ligase family protein [Streptomyces sp. NPDC004237]|uniref:RNA ligase family protein n=1 Tax=Streptomyces sp. NPDC004237 TaxID=3154455 RepID=UPI0033BE671C